jgi:hypothetical protein
MEKFMKGFLQLTILSLTLVASYSAHARYTAGSYAKGGTTYNCKIECTGSTEIQYFNAELSANGNVQCDAAHAPAGACAGRFVPGSGTVPFATAPVVKKK